MLRRIFNKIFTYIYSQKISMWGCSGLISLTLISLIQVPVESKSVRVATKSFVPFAFVKEEDVRQPSGLCDVEKGAQVKSSRH